MIPTIRMSISALISQTLQRCSARYEAETDGSPSVQPWLRPGLLLGLILAFIPALFPSVGVFAGSLAFSLPVSVAAAEHDTVYDVGVLAFRNREHTIQQWSPLVEYLNDTVADRAFRLQALYYDDLDEAVLNRTVDFVFTNPAHFIAIGRANDLSGAMATVIMDDDGHPVSYFGSVIFARASDGLGATPLTIADLQGSTIAAVNRDSLGGYQAAAYELVLAGLRLDRDVEFTFTGMPHDQVLTAVLSGEADAGFIRTGVLESLMSEGLLQPEQIQVVNRQSPSHFPQLLSTELFPEWPFVALPHVDSETAKRVAAALFSLEPYSPTAQAIGIQGFTVPANYLVVEEMMRSLGLPPFSTTAELTLAAIWQAYRWVLVTAGLLAMLLLAATIIQHRDRRIFKKKNEELHRLHAELEQANAALRELSMRDPLTKLYNRRYFDTVFPDRIQTARRLQNSLALAVIDLDDFKAINDSLGHAVGDRALCQVAAALEQTLQRATDFAVRLGGDEFLMVMSDTNEDGLRVVCRRLRRAMAEILLDDGTGKPMFSGITASIGGMAVVPTADTTAQSMLHMADQALYDAKRRGRRQLVVHEGA